MAILLVLLFNRDDARSVHSINRLARLCTMCLKEGEEARV